MNVSSLLAAFHHQLDQRPDAVALIGERDSSEILQWTWRELGRQVAIISEAIEHRFADPSRERSLSPESGRSPERGDEDSRRCIGHACDNSPESVAIALAAMSLGIVEIPIDRRLHPDSIGERWSRITSGSQTFGPVECVWLEPGFHLDTDIASARVGGPEDPGTANGIQINDRLDCPSLVLWTSGTTGTPQGVTLSVRNLFGNAAAKLTAVPQTPDDVRLCSLPISHAYARTCDLGTWLLSGCTLAITLGYEGLERLAPRVGPTLLNVVPAMATRLREARPSGLDRLRLLGCGGAAMTARDYEQWRQLGVTVIQGYGLTETSPVICSASPTNAAPGCVGDFVDGWQWQLREGQLYVRGPHVMLGYWDDAGATRERIDHEGWLRTGDLVEWDTEARQLRVLGRVDDVIVLDSAHKIHPASVERSVQLVGGVSRAMLVHRERLELWYEAEQGSATNRVEASIRAELERHAGLSTCLIHRFERPLSESLGELTSKGTLRRKQVMRNRFPDHAGS